jgi:large subunit ribosomal protein L3
LTTSKGRKSEPRENQGASGTFFIGLKMLNTILGLKGKMSQSFIDGRRVTVAKMTAGPCVVTQIKTQDHEGYWALQLGIGTKSPKNITKPLQGHYKKSQSNPRFVREVRFSEEPTYKVGDEVKAIDIFKVGDIVSVTGISKGKGFEGGVRRYHFHGGSQTHGQSDRPRAPGAISSGTTPGRVKKGKRMAGHMGTDTKTIKNLQIIAIRPDLNEIDLSGPIPGIPGNLVILNRLHEGKLEGLQEVQAQIVEGKAAPTAEGATTNA